ncbi:unnamed protein product [Ostreobium quekettii]|uniref:2-hydroxyacyl-CoA lyase n=1 Tax=Ostreobium quekettii TaxID=121088 RepID=A0A8S1J3G1_9CHLO|nr:unnamed protein product [Ostreobium quekettii]|eukprot:evm.model.scf_1084.4 EVM.evm.TU.scf_1084.4   scf_1084:18690-22219(+)
MATAGGAVKRGGGKLVPPGGGPPWTTHTLCEAGAAALHSIGLRRGDVVAAVAPNCAEAACIFIGALSAGIAVAPLNPSLKQAEFDFEMSDAGAVGVVLPSGGCPDAEAAAKSLGLGVWRPDFPPGAEKLTLEEICPRMAPEGDTTSGCGEEVAEPEDVAVLLHTSGTTARPKLVPLTQANVAASLRNIAATYDLCDADTTLLVMPMFHVHGMMAGLLTSLAAGGTVVLPEGGKFSASSFWRDVVANGVTWYTAVPTIHQILLMRAEQDYPADNPPRLRFIRSCSAALAPAVLERLESRFGAPVLEAYAMTEAAHQMTSNPLPKYGDHRAGTVGRGVNVEVAILDAQNQLVPAGTVGEVCIRGENVTKGYVNNPKANEDGFAGGWFHTGDQGHLSEDGYLTLTGRIKELINRGGEKISPLEVDAALLRHPAIGEAVAFGVPDEKYGEEVNAAVVLKPDCAATSEEIISYVGEHLAAMKLPKKLFIATELPRTATGKIQRRHVAKHFSSQGEPVAGRPQLQSLGYVAIAQSLAAFGIRYMFGVVGIPVTPLATAAQAAGIRFVGFRNEQAAGFAAACCGYLTGTPAVLLTVSGPGAVNGLAALNHAQANRWPLIMLAGSTSTQNVGKGGFQECDQMQAARPFCKALVKLSLGVDVRGALLKVVKEAVTGCPGAVYVDVPADVLMQPATKPSREPVILKTHAMRGSASLKDVKSAVELLKQGRRPLLVIGKGAALSQAEESLRALVDQLALPFLPTPMGRGVVPDSSPLYVGAARSAALRECDVALVVGARLNWMLHYGEPPRWDANCKFILVDVSTDELELRQPQVALNGDAATVCGQLLTQWSASGSEAMPQWKEWQDKLAQLAATRTESLNAKLLVEKYPLDFYTALGVIRRSLHSLHIDPVIVSEGANTMDFSRTVLSHETPRSRLDAGTHGTMGLGLGYAVAAALCNPERLVVACEGDSAFGFSGLECETICRFKLSVCILVFNNGGVYGGDRRKNANADGVEDSWVDRDPAPTAFVPGAKYELVMEAFGGRGFHVSDASGLDAACKEAFKCGGPSLINIDIDPSAGAESGHLESANRLPAAGAKPT